MIENEQGKMPSFVRERMEMLLAEDRIGVSEIIELSGFSNGYTEGEVN